MALLLSFFRNETGATSVEYCLIAGFISIAVVAGATSIGGNINPKFFGPLASGLN